MSPRWIHACLLLLCGCQTSALSVREQFLAQQGRSIVLVVDRSRQPRGVGVVSRATYGELCVTLAAKPGELPARPLLALGDQAVPATVRAGRGVLVLAARRAGRDLRPAVAGPPPAAGTTVIVLTATRGPWIDLWTTEALEGDSNRLLLGPLQGTDEEDRAPQPATLKGWPVFSVTGNLLGFLMGLDESRRLVVGPIDRFAIRILEASGEARGADLLGPQDAERAFSIRTDRVDGLPAIDDGWGAADFDLLLTVAGEPQQRLPLPAGEIEGRAPAAGPVVARLVERDEGLFEGLVSEDVAHPVRLESLARSTSLQFDLLGRLQERYGPTSSGLRPSVELRVEPLEPDRNSGLDSAVLGASPASFGRAARGTLDRGGGDATDLWSIDLDQAEPVWCAVLRPQSALLAVDAFGPGLGESLARWPQDDGTPASLAPPGFGPEFGRLVDRPPLVSVGPQQGLRPQPGARLSIGSASLPAGRCLLRVRSLRAAPLSYGLVVSPRRDPEGLLRGLFRLISREAQRGPELHDPAFVDEVAGALRQGAGLTDEAARAGLLAELGHRTPAVRRLVLGLLERQFAPPAVELERIVRTGMGNRALDAELLLALRRPDPASARLVKRAAGDADPWIRVRALWIASRLEDPEQREALLATFDADPAPMIQRALARARS